MTVCILFNSADSFSADISSRDTSGLFITGTIEHGDYKKFLEVYFEAAKNLENGESKYVNAIYISSPGGDFSEAIKIANFIEEAKLTVWVSEKKECNSACVFIVIGAAQRGLMGDKIGLHRPYISRQSYSAELNQDAEKKQKQVMKFAKSWLEERFVPRDITDALIFTPSYKVRYMDSDAFLKKIGFQSPIHQEWVAGLCGFMTENESVLAAAYTKYLLYEKFGADYLRDRGWHKDLEWIQYGKESGRIRIMEDASNKEQDLVICEQDQVRKFRTNFFRKNKGKYISHIPK